jgi:uroporphyrinogen-III decarboxylase
VKADCDRLLEEYSQRGGLILSSACEVPPLTPSANIMAMVRSAKDWK